MLQYKVYYKAKKGDEYILRDFVTSARDPIDAIDQFHNVVQEHLEPTEYVIQTMVQFYRDTPPSFGGTGRYIESVVDLPKSPNPTVHERIKRGLDQTMEMTLDDARHIHHD